MAEDITKIGPVGLKGLKGIGQQQQAELSDYSRAIRSMSGRGLAQTFVPDAEVPVGMQLAAAGYGESTYDDTIQNVSQLEDIQDIRAQEQPWYAQLGAGIGKGVALAATTFLDGTVGLVTGIVEGVGAKISGDSWGDSVAKLWHNEVSDGLADLNKNLEEWLPNYRTYEELENPWYNNLGTMNFWADNVIKNLGFTVGAFYSGGAWNKALKAVGALKGAMGAKVLGSFTSALNEGRIEANQNSRDFLELQYKQIDDALNEQLSYLDESDLSNDEINAQKALLRDRADELKEDAKERANAMGLTTLIGNTVLLSLDNFDTFGKLYARGYKNARTISKGRVTREAMSEGLEKAGREIAQEEAGKRITKEAGKYIYDPVSKKRALARGLRHGLVEGNEEMAQAFIAETAGQMQSPDSPDAYYEALLDPTAEIKTRDFIGSVTDGFVNTYGNGDRWEEFAVGAFTGLLGIPTFGKVQNSDVNTWLGRGRTVGISGGLFGEFGIANKENMEGQEAVDFMNNYAQRVQEQKGHFVRSQSFTDAMDGWAKADDAFEYKNAEDNSDFAAISRFAKVGRINDLRDMVNQDFENIPDEELAKIAEFTSPVDGLGGWRNMDGSLMSDTEEGRAQMREELKQKRDKILAEIDRYEKSVETVRAIGNNSLTEDQINELAWLNWKVGTFTDRYNSIKEESQEFLAEMKGSLQAFQSGRGRGMIDEKSEEGQKILKAMDNAEMFIDALRSSKTPLQLAAIMEANPHITQFIEEIGYPILEDIVGVDAATFEKSMTDLKDAIKIAKATKTFNQRYKEFRDNPIELIKNRQKIDKKKEKVNKAAEDVNLKDKVDNADVSEIVHGMESGDLDEGKLDGLFSDEDNEFLNNVGTEGQLQPSGRQKVEEAKKIIKTSQRMDGAIDGLDDGSIDPQALADAHTLLQHSKQVSESEQEMLDTASQAYNDPTLLYDENDPSMQDVSQEELESILGERIDAAKSVIEQAKAVLSEQNDELDDLPEGAPIVREITPEEAQGKETGHDATEHTPTENERQKAEAAQRAAQALNAEEQAKVNNLFQDLKEGMPQENVEAFDKAVSEVLKSIDMLIDAKATNQEIGKLVKNTQSYQTAKQLAPELDDYLNVYVTSRLNPKAAEPAKQEEEPKIATPVITDQEVRQQTTAQRTVDPNQGEFTGTYQYWKPTTSYLPFGRAYVKGDNTPFYKIARTLKNQDGTPAYSEPTLRRIEAVGRYLEEHGAFKLVDSGAVKVGSNVHFTIDSTLNDQVGELVILMTDDQGRVIGDVMSPTDPRFANQLGLPQLVERITTEYKEAGSPQHFTSKEVTTVDKNMVGKIPYLADHEVMHTLNEVFVDGEQQVPFKIGIAVNSGKNARILASAGRTKKQGQSDLERSINPPLTAKAGQPFLLLPTSSSVNAYMTVPIMMDSYSPATQGTALGKAIHKVLERVPTSDNAHVMEIINDLEELLSVQEIHINYNGDNVKVTIKPNGAEHQMTIYNGAKNTPNIVEQLELGLQGQPFQVSRKYMNEDYDGQDYNRMIGEVAKVNLPIGTTHTVSDWFTIKPINANGQKMKTKSPRSTGSNPHAATPQYITITKKGIALNVNPATWEVTDSTGKVYTGPNTDKVKAQAFGMHMNKNMEQPYDTEWGYYDPKIDEFVEKPNRVLRTLGAPSTSPSKKELNKNEPSTIEERIIIMTSNNGEYQVFGFDPNNGGDKNNTRAMKFWRTRADTRSLRNPKTGNSVQNDAANVYIPLEDGTSVITYFQDKNGRIFGRRDGTGVNVWRHLTPEEVKEIQEGLLNNRFRTFDEMAKFVDKVLHKELLSTEQTNRVLRILEEPQQDITEDAKKLYDKVSKTHPWLIDLMAVTKEFLENSNKRKETKESLMKRFKNRATDEGRDIVSDNDLATLIDYILGSIIENPATQGIQESETPAQLEEKAKKAGLLGNKVRQSLWQILSTEQQSTIANKKGPKQKQWMDVLEIAFDPTTNTFDEAKLKGTVDEFLGRKGMYRKTDGSQRVWDKQKETKWLASVLPNLSTDEHFQIVNGLIRVAESSTPDYAYGQFKRGIMVISDQAAKGTVYHEAFHAVTHTLLTTQEYKDMFDAAKQKWGDIPRLALEENLAEDFRRYVQLEETPVIGSLVKIYRTLKHLVQNLFGKEPYLNKMFYNINRGKLANRSVSESKANRYRYADKVSELEHSIKSIDQDIQSIRDQRRLATQNKAAIKWRTVNGKRYAQISTTGYLFESEALRNIPSEYRDIVTPIGIYDGTSYRYYLHLKSKEESDSEIKQLKESKERLKQQLERLKDNKWDIISEEALQEQEEAYYRRIEQYHTDKMMYNNLSQDDKDYLTERGITPTEYSQMTQLEKEVLFHCKY